MIRRLSVKPQPPNRIQPSPQAGPTLDTLHDGFRFTGQASIEYPVTPLWQGYTNGCGTTSMAMVLNALSEISGQKSEPYTQKQFDQKRPFDLYCAPGTLVKLAKSHGFYAQQYNQASFQDIKSHLDQGHLLIALHNAVPLTGKQGPLHYFVIRGYQDGSDESTQKLLIVDPGHQDPNKARFELSYKELCKYWKRPRLGCMPIGAQQFIIAVSAKDELPAKRPRLPVTIHLANFFHNLVNWYATSWVRPVFNALYQLVTWPLRALKLL